MSLSARPVLDQFRKKTAPAVGPLVSLGVVARERRVQAILASIDQLPSLPDVVMHVLRLASQDNTQAADFEKVVRKDQALTAKVLKLVNSSFFGLRTEVTTIPQAIVVLGFKTLRSVVLAAKTSDLLNRQLGPYGYEEGGLWKHSMACADLSQGLARRLGLGSEAAEQLYIAGLLHDVGKIILAPYIADAPGAFAKAVERNGGDVSSAEEKEIGISHAGAGGRMAKKWNLPERLHDLIAGHHVLLAAGGNDAPADRALVVVQLADDLCNQDGVGRLEGGRPASDRYAGLLDILGVAGDRAEIEEEAASTITALRSMFHSMGAV